jgi:hypothetical protein
MAFSVSSELWGSMQRTKIWCQQSQFIVMQDVTPQSLEYKLLNLIASLQASEIAIYSSSIVDRAIVAC